MMDGLKAIADLFLAGKKTGKVEPIGEGLINDTYKVILEGESSPSYVLQRINHHVFEDVELLQDNIVKVTRHIRQKLLERGVGDPERKVLEVIPLGDGPRTFYRDPDTSSYWRMLRFIDGVTHQSVDAYHSELCGEAFGAFQSMLSDFPLQIGETIPRFHDMEFRLEQFKEALEKDPRGRAAEVRDMIQELLDKAERYCTLERLHRSGMLPKRICHCDTKVNNMLFDKDGKVLLVIDLDTVMPSFVSSDFGDFLRTAASSIREDDPNVENLEFRKDVFEAFSRGYLRSASHFLTDMEKEILSLSVGLFPYMQCVRFLTDYIQGDTYYKIQYPEHNLIRSRNQLHLLRKVESLEDYIRSFIEGLV